MKTQDSQNKQINIQKQKEHQWIIKKKKSLYPNVYSGIVHNKQKPEKIRKSIIWWMDKQNTVCLHKRTVIFSNQNKSTDTWAT